MNNRQFSIQRCIISAVGLVVLALVCCLLMPAYLKGWRGGFITISALQLYILLVLPAIFTYSDEKKKDSLIIGGTVYYRGFGIFAVIIIALDVLTAMMLLSAKVAAGGDILAIFIVLVYGYLAGTSKAHIDNVSNREGRRIQTLDLLKQKAVELQVRTDNMNGDQTDIRERVKKLAENLRYLSPSRQAQALQLESKMLDAITCLTDSDMASNKNTGSDDLIRRQLDNIETLYKLRKNIY